MTPSAARGLIEAVLWKPAIQWHIERIAVLSPIRFVAIRRNEVSTKAAKPAAALVKSGGPAPLYFADEDRAQRNTVALRDVDYLVEAHFTLTDRAAEGDNVPKFVDMFNRRVAKGQHYHQPYFGCREFAANVIPVDDPPSPIDDSRDLGIMLWDVEYAKAGNRPVFFHAELVRGVLDVAADAGAAAASLAAAEGGAP
jgi:CRISPR-associated protein Cas5d